MAKVNENLKRAAKKTQFSSTNQPKKSGRKKNRFTHLKNQFELSKSDVENIVTYLLSISLDELRKLAADKERSTIEIAFAKAVLNDIKYSDLSKVEQLLDRAIGKVSNNVELSGGVNIVYLDSQDKGIV
jgi:hypothetical protein